MIFIATSPYLINYFGGHHDYDQHLDKRDCIPTDRCQCQTSGGDGNAFAILGRVHRAIRASNRPDLADEFMREATSHDYEHLLATCSRYVTVE